MWLEGGTFPFNYRIYQSTAIGSLTLHLPKALSAYTPVVLCLRDYVAQAGNQWVAEALQNTDKVHGGGVLENMLGVYAGTH